MTDSESDWTFRFPDIEGDDGPFEIRPLTLNISLNRSDYDHAKAKFHKKVGEMMKPHTDRPGGELRWPTYVYACYNGEEIYPFYFKPDYASYGDQYTRLEFRDLQKSLDSGVVDKEWKSVKLKEAYKEVYNTNSYSTINPPLKGIKFADTPRTELVGQTVVNVPTTRASITERARIEADATKQLVDSEYAVDIDKASPVKAIYKLNQRFKVQTWVGKDRYLWVGSPEANTASHIAAPNDDRVWRFNPEDVHIRHPREPVKQVTVEGAWVDEPGLGGLEDAIDEVISWYDSGHQGGTGDVIAHGTAYRTDIGYGESLMYSSTEAKKSALRGIAESIMRELMKEGHSGQVELNPTLSGDHTPIESVTPGDFIQLVPNDKYFTDPTADSGHFGDVPDALPENVSIINNESYFIQGVQHNIDEDGWWSVTLDVSMYPDVLDENMKSQLRYFDPQDEDWLTEEELDEASAGPSRPKRRGNTG